MSEKLLRPWIRLVMLFYTFPLPLTFQSFSFSFFSFCLCHVPWLSVENVRILVSFEESVCVLLCVRVCFGHLCHAFALSVTMLSRAYLTGLNPCSPWPIASSPTSVSHLLWSQKLIHFLILSVTNTEDCKPTSILYSLDGNWPICGGVVSRVHKYNWDCRLFSHLKQLKVGS